MFGLIYCLFLEIIRLTVTYPFLVLIDRKYSVFYQERRLEHSCITTI